MKEAKTPGKPVDTEVEGATVESHGFMVTPVARVCGGRPAPAATDGETGNTRGLQSALCG